MGNWNWTRVAMAALGGLIWGVSSAIPNPTIAKVVESVGLFLSGGAVIPTPGQNK